jgi:hypothetical protein
LAGTPFLYDPVVGPAAYTVKPGNSIQHPSVLLVLPAAIGPRFRVSPTAPSCARWALRLTPTLCLPVRASGQFSAAAAAFPAWSLLAAAFAAAIVAARRV